MPTRFGKLSRVPLLNEIPYNRFIHPSIGGVSHKKRKTDLSYSFLYLHFIDQGSDTRIFTGIAMILEGVMEGIALVML